MDELLAVAEENDGFVTANQARKAGIVGSVLARLAQRGKLERAARGVYRIPYFPLARFSQYREALLWVRSDAGPENVALSHETALAVYGITDVNPSIVHITIPRQSRLRRNQPKWILLHRAELQSNDVIEHEGLPITTIARTTMDVLTSTGRIELIRTAISDARREGYLSKTEADQLRKQVNKYVRGLAQNTQARKKRKL
jgi:predicted transcriptional regulator of viral defense system